MEHDAAQLGVPQEEESPLAHHHAYQRTDFLDAHLLCSVALHVALASAGVNVPLKGFSLR